jgi:multisubunit Na+/H+ antiporter MnhB subunit
VRSAYVHTTRFLSVLLVVLGIAMIVSTLVRGGGALAVGLVFGVALVVLGLGRLWLARGTTP